MDVTPSSGRCFPRTARARNNFPTEAMARTWSGFLLNSSSPVSRSMIIADSARRFGRASLVLGRGLSFSRDFECFALAKAAEGTLATRSAKQTRRSMLFIFITPVSADQLSRTARGVLDFGKDRNAALLFLFMPGHRRVR